MLPEELQKKALFRYEVIKPLVYLEVDFLSPYIDMRVNEFEAKGEKVSRASIYRWLSDYRTGNYDIRSLVSSYHRRGKGKRLNKEVEMVIERFIDKYYLAKERRTVKTIFELISHQINVENKSRLPSNQLQLPSESTVLRRIKERDEFEITKSRKGKKQPGKSMDRYNFLISLLIHYSVPKWIIHLSTYLWWTLKHVCLLGDLGLRVY